MAQEKKPSDSQERVEEFNSDKRHEIGLNVINAIGGLGINPRYEYVLGRQTGVGVDLNISIWENDKDQAHETVETFSFTPYYRRYFFSKEDYGAKGIYGEGFTKLYSFEVDRSFFFNNNSIPIKSFTEIAIGAGIGWKWVSNSGFLIDLELDLERNLGIANDSENLYNFSAIEFKGGLHLGWRF
jgi:hypothetical protein